MWPETREQAAQVPRLPLTPDAERGLCVGDLQWLSSRFWVTPHLPHQDTSILGRKGGQPTAGICRVKAGGAGLLSPEGTCRLVSWDWPLGWQPGDGPVSVCQGPTTHTTFALHTLWAWAPLVPGLVLSADDAQ